MKKEYLGLEYLIFDNLEELEKDKIFEKSNEICSNCLEIFGSCNKCIGNLLQYRNLTKNDFFYSYCRLVNELSEIFIIFKLKYIDNISIYISDKFLFSNKPVENNKVVILEEKGE